jgi:hypothetical protein
MAAALTFAKYLGAVAGAIGRGAGAGAKGAAQEIRLVSPRTLRPTHLPDSKSKVDALVRAIKKEGYNPSAPISAVEADGALYIRDGHHRTAAAIKAGMREVEVEVTSAGSAEEVKQLFREWAQTLNDGGF